MSGVGDVDSSIIPMSSAPLLAPFYPTSLSQSATTEALDRSASEITSSETFSPGEALPSSMNSEPKGMNLSRAPVFLTTRVDLSSLYLETGTLQISLRGRFLELLLACYQYEASLSASLHIKRTTCQGGHLTFISAAVHRDSSDPIAQTMIVAGHGLCCMILSA